MGRVEASVRLDRHGHAAGPDHNPPSLSVGRLNRAILPGLHPGRSGFSRGTGGESTPRGEALSETAGRSGARCPERVPNGWCRWPGTTRPRPAWLHAEANARQIAPPQARVAFDAFDVWPGGIGAFAPTNRAFTIRGDMIRAATLRQRGFLADLVVRDVTGDEVSRLILGLKRERATTKNLVAAIIEAERSGDRGKLGTLLVELRGRTAHGEWLPILGALEISPRRAQRAMKRARVDTSHAE